MVMYFPSSRPGLPLGLGQQKRWPHMAMLPYNTEDPANVYRVGELLWGNGRKTDQGRHTGWKGDHNCYRSVLFIMILVCWINGWFNLAFQHWLGNITATSPLSSVPGFTSTCTWPCTMQATDCSLIWATLAKTMPHIYTISY